MTIPNLITLARILLVPLIVWTILSDEMTAAFLLFLVAGLSDAVDGAVARYFDQQSELGTILDPIADKMMLVTVFVVLSYQGHIPLWLGILIVSRDFLIIVGVALAFILFKDVTIKPLWVSKANTLAQIVLAAWVLASLAFGFGTPEIDMALVWIVGILTGLSTIAYIWEGLKLFGNDDKVPNKQG